MALGDEGQDQAADAQDPQGTEKKLFNMVEIGRRAYPITVRDDI